MKAMCIQAAPVVVCVHGGILPSDVPDIKVQVIAGFDCLTWAGHSILWNCGPRDTLLHAWIPFTSHECAINSSILHTRCGMRRCRASRYFPSEIQLVLPRFPARCQEHPAPTMHPDLRVPRLWHVSILCNVDLAGLQTLAALVVAPEP